MKPSLSSSVLLNHSVAQTEPRQEQFMRFKDTTICCCCCWWRWREEASVHQSWPDAAVAPRLLSSEAELPPPPPPPSAIGELLVSIRWMCGGISFPFKDGLIASSAILPRDQACIHLHKVKLLTWYIGNTNLSLCLTKTSESCKN